MKISAGTICQKMPWFSTALAILEQDKVGHRYFDKARRFLSSRDTSLGLLDMLSKNHLNQYTQVYISGETISYKISWFFLLSILELDKVGFFQGICKWLIHQELKEQYEISLKILRFDPIESIAMIQCNFLSIQVMFGYIQKILVWDQI